MQNMVVGAPAGLALVKPVGVNQLSPAEGVGKYLDQVLDAILRALSHQNARASLPTEK